MENNFRLVLIILSGFVISGIFLHGLWTIRKNKKNPYKLRTSNQPIEPIEPVVDKAGFDQDGIGKVKVLKKEPLANDAVSQQPEIQTNNNETLAVQNEQNNVDCAETSVVETPILTEDRSLQGHSQHESIDTLEPHTSKSPEILAFPNMSQDIDMSDELNVGASKSIDSTDINERQEPKISFEEPVIQPKPQRKKLATKAKVDQIEIEFGDPINAPRDIDKPKYKAPKQVEDVEPQVLIISVVAADGNTISGAALLPSLLTLGMRYGDMDIFHRHQDNAGNGKVTFSCANMLNPGTFDIDNMENFTTKGISLFMKLPNAEDPFVVFNQMLNAAKQLAEEFSAQVLDGQRSVMTKQTEQHYISQIREFDRKSRIASF